MRQHKALLYGHSTEVQEQAVVQLVPYAMKLRHCWMRQHKALLYGHSTEVQEQTGAKRQKEELVTMIVEDRALKLLALTCRRIFCTRISLKE